MFFIPIKLRPSKCTFYLILIVFSVSTNYMHTNSNFSKATHTLGWMVRLVCGVGGYLINLLGRKICKLMWRTTGFESYILLIATR